MFKIYKNQFFNYIEKLEFNIDDFSIEESVSIFMISVRDTSMFFRFKLSDTKPDFFSYEYSTFTPGFIVEGQKWIGDFNEVLAKLDDWLQNNVNLLLNELDEPDLWERYMRYADVFPTFKSSEHDYEEFSDDEKLQIKNSITNFGLLIIENYHPNDEQLEAINGQLDYLNQAVDRLNLIDWKSVAFSTLIGIATNLAVDTEGGRRLFELFQEAFSQIIQLLP